MDKKLLLKAFTQPVVMFLFGVGFTLFVFASIAPSMAESSNNNFVNGLVESSTEIPRQTADDRETFSPKNFFDTSQIKVYRDRVILEVENVLWAGFTDTNSMLPVIDKNSNALQIAPDCPEEITVGDIVSYRSDYADGIIIHRVVHIDEDDQGVYFVLKGDNNPSSDPGRVRCSQIDRKVIGILY